MPSPDAQSVDLPFSTFGGLVSQFDPQALPPGASPFNRDVIYSGQNSSATGIVGGVGSRPGMGSGFYSVPFSGNPTVNYLKSFTDSAGILHQLSLDSLGNVRDESPCSVTPTTPAIIGSVVAASFIQSDSLVNREWMAVGDGKFGLDIPRQWDGTYFDRVSQVGPGAAPSIADGAAGNIAAGLHQFSVSFVTREQYITKPAPFASWTAAGSKKANLTNIPTGPPNIIARLLLFTPVITPPAIGGDFFTFQAAVPTPTLGTFPTMLIPDNTTTSYTVDFTDAVLQNPLGKVTYLFNMLELGECSCVQSYSSRTFWSGERNKVQNFNNLTFDGGFATNPSATSSGPNSPTAAVDGNNGAQPWVNPGNVFALDGVLASSAITQANIVSNFLMATGFGFAIPANATIVGVVVKWYVKGSNSLDLSDNGVYLVVASAVAGANRANGNTWTTMVAAQVYGSSTDTWQVGLTPAVVNASGFGAAMQASNNSVSGTRTAFADYCSIQIYYTTPGGSSNPLGWTQGANFAGGSSALGAALTAYWGDAYAITGDGATATRGQITQSAFQDSLGVPIISRNVSYRVRARVAKNGALTTGTLHINLQSTSGAFTTAGLQVTAAQLSTTYAEFVAFLTDVPLATPPSDLLLQIYADGTPTSAGVFLVDNVEPYPANQPNNQTIVRASYAGAPEAFDSVTGLLIVGQDNGQAVRSIFKLLDNKLYFVKERSMYATQDDNQNEPSSWTINLVSGTVGTPSTHGVGIGESWAIIAFHDGVYIFWGSEPVKISQEIQPDWDTINWQFGQTIYVLVDTSRKRVHIGAPTGASTVPNVEFVMDYSQLANSEGSTSAEDIVAHPQAYYSLYNPGKVIAPGKARKWTIWNISMNCAALGLRVDGSYHLLRGNASGNGKIYDQVSGTLSDDGVAVNPRYQTSFFPDSEAEMGLQLGSHRKLCKYLTGYAFGAGTMSFTINGSQNQRALALSNLTLSNPATGDFEKNVNFISERMSLLVSTNSASAWFVLVKLCPTIQKELITPVRGRA